MLEDPSDSHKQPTPLHAAPTEEYHAPEYLVPAPPFQAGRLIQHNQASATRSSGSRYSRIVRLWHRDPAYKVLFVAIGVVLVSGIVCIALLARLITQISPSSAPITHLPPGPQPAPTFAVLPTPQATATPVPTPIPTPTAVITPSPIVTAPAIIQPTPNPDQRLTAQIGPLPAQINNNVIVPVTVTTNQPGATVSLFVTYSAIPILYTSNPQITDASGSTTFSWSVHERTFSPFTRMVAANLTAIVRYQGRQQATSQTMTVHILTK